MNSRLEQIRRLNFWNGNHLEEGQKRPFYTDRISSYLGSRLVKVIVGQRRTGKSYILRQIISNLISSGVPDTNTLYINLEFADFSFLQTSENLLELINIFIAEFVPKGAVYIFLDEIHNIPGWEKVINSLSQDPALNCEVFVTGSNSKMLSGELATWLSGRYVEFEIFPFSYQEFIESFDQRTEKQTLANYLATSGLPEFLHLKSDDTRRNYLESVKDTVLLRDVVSRYKIKDVPLLDSLFAYAVNNSSNLLSIKNLVDYVKSGGVDTNYDTVNSYMSYLCQSFLLHKCERYNVKGKETLTGPAKYYANDQAYHNYLYGGYGYGLGYQVENYVYLTLRRYGYSCYVGTWDKREIDFVAIKGDDKLYVQAAYIIADKTAFDREYSPLLQVKDSFRKIVVTMDDLKQKNYDGIEHVQAWNLESWLERL